MYYIFWFLFSFWTDKETERYASTADVMVGDGSVLQFELSMGCGAEKEKDEQCFGKLLDFARILMLLL